LKLLSLLPFAYLLDINIHYIIKSLPQLPLKLQIAIQILLKKILITSLREGTQYYARTVLLDLHLKHELFDQPLLQLHQVINLQITECLIALVAIPQMPSLQVRICEIVALMKERMPFSLDIIAVAPSLLADEVQIAIFGISKHPQ
jgi:hypothetical protein